MDDQIKEVRKGVCSRYTRRLRMEQVIDKFYADPGPDKEQAMIRLDKLEGKKRQTDVFWVSGITSLIMSAVWHEVEVVLDLIGIPQNWIIIGLAAITIVLIMWIPVVAFGMTNDFLWSHSYERDYELKVLKLYLEDCMAKDKAAEKEAENEHT